MLRALYSLLWYLATPWIRAYLRRRGRLAPAYLQNWHERFGRRFTPRQTGAIWLHAVSVGETRAALPLVEALRERWPDAPLLITQMTPTGRATAESLYGADAEVRYLPYDYPGSVDAFFRDLQPRFGILMETEIWPNLIAAARRHRVPLFLANARLSEKSFNGYRKIAWLAREAFAGLTAVAAQSQADAERLSRAGATDVSVCGNTKYDFVPPAAQLALGDTFRRAIGCRPVLVCASTRDGEEQRILDAWSRQRPTGCLLVLVPRHPERFGDVARLAREAGLTVRLRSEAAPAPDTDVWIGDSMGEMFAYYRAADLVFIGGSLLPLGGQNLIEPASIGVPVLMGPSTYNFAEASAQAFACGAALQVADAGQMVAKINELLAEPHRRAAMAQAALAFSQAHRGASRRIVGLIAARLPALSVTE